MGNLLSNVQDWKAPKSTELTKLWNNYMNCEEKLKKCHETFDLLKDQLIQDQIKKGFFVLSTRKNSMYIVPKEEVDLDLEHDVSSKNEMSPHIVLTFFKTYGFKWGDCTLFPKKLQELSEYQLYQEYLPEEEITKSLRSAKQDFVLSQSELVTELIKYGYFVLGSRDSDQTMFLISKPYYLKMSRVKNDGTKFTATDDIEFILWFYNQSPLSDDCKCFETTLSSVSMKKQLNVLFEIYFDLPPAFHTSKIL